MSAQNDRLKFLEAIEIRFSTSILGKCTLGKPRKKNQTLRNVFIRPVLIANQKQLSFVYRYNTRDITKNYPLPDALDEIKNLMESEFLQANLFSTDTDMQLMVSKKGRTTVKIMKPSSPMLQALSHDRIKHRLISPEGKIYLQELGITDQHFKVIPSMNSKYRQINKFVEIINSIMKGLEKQTELSVVDMGSGKGYLTFALYDYLVNTLKINARVTGVEIRKELVDRCNRIAKKADFRDLSFSEGKINDHDLDATDMLIALHACDTATDDAISKGIRAGAATIIVAPCCHKQVRKAMQPGKSLQPLLRHGIFLERQAEIITDALRALFLEKYGYKVKTLEFISTEHTPKNVMIVAEKTAKNVNKREINKHILEIKQIFGLEYHQLEMLLEGY